MVKIGEVYAVLPDSETDSSGLPWKQETFGIQPTAVAI